MFPEKWKSADWHRPEECYVEEDGDHIRIGNSIIERVFSREGGRLRTVSITNKLTNRTWNIEATDESRLTLGVAKFRFDIRAWRFALGSKQLVSPQDDLGYRNGYHDASTDDGSWQVLECLTAGFGERPREDEGPVWPGYAWFRSSFPLPADAVGQPLVLGFGGYDNEDWEYYRVFVNGVEVGSRELSGRWRQPAPFVLNPTHPAYGKVQFGGDNLVAIQAGRLDKRVPGIGPADPGRLRPRSRLVDQFISVGTPTQVLSDFHPVDFWPDSRIPIVPEFPYYYPKSWAYGGDRDWMWLTLWTENDAGNIRMVHHYGVRSGDPVMRKKVEVQNRGDTRLLVLDLEIERFGLDGNTSEGGQGFPVLLDDEAFCAIEHPAGVNQGLGNGVRLFHLPGRTIEPGQSLMSKEAVLGVGQRAGGRDAFHQYLRKNGRRREQFVSVHDPAGITDGYVNPQEPRYHYTEQIMLDSIDVLDTLRTRGITMDYFVIDVGWQDHFSDLTWFKPDNFPNGPAKIIERLDELNIKFGLWLTPTSKHWSAADYPPVQGCVGGTGDRNAAHFCMAAEPYRSVFRNALLHHIRENKARAFKLDSSHYYCNSTEHDHLPGKYSVEAGIDGTIEAAKAANRACPELFIIWYWGHFSPFYLLHGDTVFDKGLSGETTEVARFPCPIYRSSSNLCVDQNSQFAEFVPLIMQDSLGLWIGDVPVWNRISKHDWQDAWILDLARGSLLNQPWGHLAKFDRDEVDFMADWHDWMKRNYRVLLHTKPILGDPWKAEPYGYAGGDGAHALVTVNNPGFKVSRVSLTLDERIGLSPSNRGFLVRQRYRRRGILHDSNQDRLAYGDRLDLDLRPFEVIVLEIGSELSTVGWKVLNPNRVIDSSSLRIEAQEVAPEAISASVDLPPEALRLLEGVPTRAIAGELSLPAIDEQRALALALRMTKGGFDWHHREPHNVTDLRAIVEDEVLPYTTIPRHYMRMGRGSPWLLFRLPVGPRHSEKTVRLELAGILPEEVDLQLEAWLYDEWWLGDEGRFETST